MSAHPRLPDGPCPDYERGQNELPGLGPAEVREALSYPACTTAPDMTGMPCSCAEACRNYWLVFKGFTIERSRGRGYGELPPSSPSCVMCGGTEFVSLGQLGRRIWLSCRACGWENSTDAEESSS